MRLKLRDLMSGVLGVAFLLGWIVGWEQLRIRRLQAVARAIRAEDTNDPLATYHSPEEALYASQRVMENAHMWAEGGPDLYGIIYGALIAACLVSLSISTCKSVEVELRKHRKAELSHDAAPPGVSRSLR
jgi:hypothetical protein